MSFLSLILGIALLGFVLYLIERFIPMAEPLKILIRVLVALAVIYWLIQAFAVPLPSLPRLR